jgi:LysR family transcriptional regulator, glycine cleavage system transcriptional activator
MLQSLPPLAWLRTFEASARLGSFAGAAKELNLTSAAVSQQIRSLEAHLGFALFDRLARGIAPTALAISYLPSVRRALDDLALATAGVFGSGGERRLTVRTPVSFGALCLAPAIASFQAQNPGIRIRLLSSIWSEAVNDDQVDVEIRYGDGRWEGFDVQRLAPPVSIPVFRPNQVASGNPLSDLKVSAANGPIHILGCENLWTQFARQTGWDERSVAGGMFVDNSVIALELAAAGLGPAMVSRELALSHLASGRIATLADMELRHDQAHHLLLPRKKNSPDATALLFANWLCNALPVQLPGIDSSKINIDLLQN